MAASEEALDLILGIPFFSRCDRQELSRLAPSLTLTRLEPGQRLYAQGQGAKDFFWILSGKLGVRHGETEPRELNEGFCGTEAALGVPTYGGEAVAQTPAEILAIPGESLLKLLSTNPRLGMDFFSLLARGAQACPVDPAARSKAQGLDGSLILGWLLTLLAPLGVMGFLPEYGFSPNQAMFLAILTATVTMWMFHLVDVFIPSLFMVLAILVFGLAPQEVALAGFASDSLFMAMSVLGLGTLIVASGLSYRFLLWVLKVTPHTPFFYNFNLALTGILLSPLLPSINARVALMTPILTDTLDLLNVRPKSPVANRLALSTFTGVSLLSPIFMTGKSTNFIIYGLLSAQFQLQFSWVYWLVASAAVGFFSLALYALSLAWWMPSRERPLLSKEVLSLQLKILGPMAYRERVAVWGILLSMVGVLSTSFHHIEPAWVALTLLLALLLSGSLDPGEFRKQVDWPFLIFLGSTVGMAKTMNFLGLDTQLAQHLTWMGDYMTHNLELFILLLALTLTLVRLVVPITASIVIAATLFMPLAEAHGINPWLIGFFILVLGENFYLPYQSSYYIQFQSLTQRAALYDEGKFLWFNAWMSLVKLLTLYLSLPYWRWLGII